MSTVRVSNIPRDAPIDALIDLFTSFGTILQSKPMNSFVDIQFQEIQDAQAALDNMNGFKFYTMYLHVSKVSENNKLDSLESGKAIWDQDHEIN